MQMPERPARHQGQNQDPAPEASDAERPSPATHPAAQPQEAVRESARPGTSLRKPFQPFHPEILPRKICPTSNLGDAANCMGPRCTTPGHRCPNSLLGGVHGVEHRLTERDALTKMQTHIPHKDGTVLYTEEVSAIPQRGRHAERLDK